MAARQLLLVNECCLTHATMHGSIRGTWLVLNLRCTQLRVVPTYHFCGKLMVSLWMTEVRDPQVISRSKCNTTKWVMRSVIGP